MFNENVSICYLKNKDGKKIPIRNPFDWVKAQHSTKSWNATRMYSNDVENYIERLWTKGAEELQKENKNFVITLSKGKKTWNGWNTYS